MLEHNESPAQGTGGLRLASRKTAPAQTLQMPSDASSGEKAIITKVHDDWFKGVQDSIVEQLAAHHGCTKEEIAVRCAVKIKEVDPNILAVAERAASLKLPIGLSIGEHLTDEVGTVGFAYTAPHSSEEEIYSWKISEMSVLPPEIHPATWSVYKRNLAHSITQRLNIWAGRATDPDAPSRLTVFGRDKKTPIVALSTLNFAEYCWTPDELEQGYRLTQNFLAYDSVGDGKCSVLLQDTHSTLPDILTPGLAGRELLGRADLCLVQFIVPIPDSLNSKDGINKFVDAFGKALGRTISRDLREELENLIIGAETESGPRLTDEQQQKVGEYQRTMDERRREQGLGSLKDVDRKGGGSLSAYRPEVLQRGKRFQEFRRTVVGDEGVEQSVRQQVMPLLGRIASQLERGGTPDPKLLEQFAQLLPQYGERLYQVI